MITTNCWPTEMGFSHSPHQAGRNCITIITASPPPIELRQTVRRNPNRSETSAATILPSTIPSSTTVNIKVYV